MLTFGVPLRAPGTSDSNNQATRDRRPKSLGMVVFGGSRFATLQREVISAFFICVFPWE